METEEKISSKYRTQYNQYVRRQIEAETTEETVISPGQVDEPTKIIRSPLLESFQRDLIEPAAEEVKENKVSELELDEFELDDEPDTMTINQPLNKSLRNLEDSHVTIEG
jgi:predicted ATPase